MKKLIFFVCCFALIVTSAALAQNFIYNSQSSSVNVDNNSDMNSSSTFNQQSSSSSSSSSGYQKNSLNVSAVNLSQPHILRINTSGSQLSGEITINGKVVKRLNNNQAEINLSPFLSVGEHKVEISGRYAPASSAVSVEISAPGTNVTQQTSGNGVLNYTLDLNIQ